VLDSLPATQNWKKNNKGKNAALSAQDKEDVTEKGEKDDENVAAATENDWTFISTISMQDAEFYKSKGS